MRMKKKYILILLSCFLSFAQNTKDFSLDWNTDKPFVIDNIKYKIPQFQSENFEFHISKRVITYVNNIKVPGLVAEGAASIENIVYETIDESKLSSLDISNIYSKIGFKSFSSYARDEAFLSFTFNPLIKDNAGYKIVKSFTLNYSISNSNRLFQSTNSIQNSVLATGSWHRFYVEKSGVYLVSKSFLQSIGVNVAVDPRNIKIYGNGGRMLPLLNSIPYPIDLEENAIQFIGEEDGVFNENDYILFYAEGVDTWNEESLTHVNQFADRSYYYVSTSGSAGKRIQTYTEPVASPTLFLFQTMMATNFMK